MRIIIKNDLELPYDEPLEYLNARLNDGSFISNE